MYVYVYVCACVRVRVCVCVCGFGVIQVGPLRCVVAGRCVVVVLLVVVVVSCERGSTRLARSIWTGGDPNRLT